tara:strand:- start:497 stop:1720 length:1224 start_codon:yes stop_codon:yes gene_type:complete
MNINTIREKIGETNKALDNLETLVKTEDREFTADESTKFDELIAEVERLTNELEKSEKQEAVRRKAANVAPVTFDIGTKEEDRVAKEYSFVDAMKAAMGDVKREGLIEEMHQEAVKEMRAIGQTPKGQVSIPSTILQNRAVITENGTTGIQGRSFIDAVYSQTILGDLGVTRLDAVLDQRIPIMGSVTTQWEGETDAAADGGSALSKIDLAPKRLASYVDVSKLATLQHGNVLESLIRSNIVKSVGAKVQYALFTDDTANGSYEWLGNGKTPVNGASLNEVVMLLIEQIMTNNHEQSTNRFALATDLFSLAYTEAQVSGVNGLVVNDAILGRMAKFSNQIAAISTLPVAYYGDWSKVFVAQFGAIDILYDPYTQAVSGKDRLVLNSFWDAALVQDAALSVGTYTAPA